MTQRSDHSFCTSRGISGTVFAAGNVSVSFSVIGPFVCSSKPKQSVVNRVVARCVVLSAEVFFALFAADFAALVNQYHHMLLRFLNFPPKRDKVDTFIAFADVHQVIRCPVVLVFAAMT